MTASLLAWLHPRLIHVPPNVRRAALREANREPFDPLELVSVAAAIVLGVWASPAGPAWLSLPSSAAAFVLLRRCRRGLRRVLEP